MRLFDLLRVRKFRVMLIEKALIRMSRKHSNQCSHMCRLWTAREKWRLRGRTEPKLVTSYSADTEQRYCVSVESHEKSVWNNLRHRDEHDEGEEDWENCHEIVSNMPSICTSPTESRRNKIRIHRHQDLQDPQREHVDMRPDDVLKSHWHGGLNSGGADAAHNAIPPTAFCHNPHPPPLRSVPKGKGEHEDNKSSLHL